MDPITRPGPLSASPRHMRRRRLRRDIAGSMSPPAPATEPAAAPREVRRRTSHRIKRLVALAVVILVSISIPSLALILVLAR